MERARRVGKSKGLALGGPQVCAGGAGKEEGWCSD